MYWLYLAIAIVLEVSGTISMKMSDGFTKLIPSILMGVFYLSSLSFLTLALKQIEVSTAYAIWSGLGIVLITIIGYFYFAESLNFTKVIAITLIIVGVIMLNLAGGHTEGS